MIKTLNQYFDDAKKNCVAIGHFNFCTADQLRAIAEASLELRVPVMAATSEGEADYIGRRQAAALVRSYRYAGIPIFLNADHHKSFDSVRACIDAGYDTVLFDGSSRTFDDNMHETRRVVEYAKSVNPDMMVEGELGYLRGKSEIQKTVAISRDDFTRPEEAKIFVEKTGVERLAIVVGNIHGIVTDQKEEIDHEVLQSLQGSVLATHLVLHGASGLGDDDISRAIMNGITNIHINTECRIAYHGALTAYLSEKQSETTPYKYLEGAYGAMKQVVIQKLKLFNKL